MARRRLRVSSNRSVDTSGVAVQTLAPAPICAGVLGITRTTASWDRPVRMAWILAPATIDSAAWLAVRVPLIPAMATGRSWGFTAKTTRSPLAAAAAPSSVAWTPYRCDRCVRRVSTGSATAISPGAASSFSSTPLRMASAIVPPPIKAMRIPSPYAGHVYCST